jgi:hypothetical protein
MRRLRLIGLAALASTAMTLPPTVTHAEDFFSALFHAFGAHRAAPSFDQGPLNYAPEQPQYVQPQYVPRRLTASGAAYCVRTCDGRYFPAPATANQSRAETCKSFCPATETKVFYGSSIEDAAGDSGKSYSELPNAYKFRSELVAGCSCNGTDPVGLAKVNITDDKTLRRGDLVVEADGIKVATGRPDSRGASLELAPAPQAVRSRFERRPGLAAN